MRSRRKHRYRTGLIAVVAVVVLAVLASGTFLVKRYAPSKEWMDGYKYFEVDSNTDKTFVIIDNKSYSDIGVMRDDVLYLPVDFVSDYINVRFYYDKKVTLFCIQMTAGHIYTSLTAQGIRTAMVIHMIVNIR